MDPLAIVNRPWAIQPDAWNALLSRHLQRATGTRPPRDPSAATAAPAAGVETTQPTGSTVSIIGIIGPIYETKRDAYDWWDDIVRPSWEAIAAVSDQLAADPGCAAVVFSINSPGGAVWGSAEACARVAALSAAKPTVAVANHFCASAAYHLAVHCREIVAAPEAHTGSVGTIMQHVDWSKADERYGILRTSVVSVPHKDEWSPDKPLDEAARARMQTVVDYHYERFKNAVAKGRKKKPDVVHETFGQGRMLLPPEALAVGMIDRVASLNDVLAGLTGSAGRGGPRSQSLSALETELAVLALG